MKHSHFTWKSGPFSTVVQLYAATCFDLFCFTPLFSLSLSFAIFFYSVHSHVCTSWVERHTQHHTSLSMCTKSILLATTRYTCFSFSVRMMSSQIPQIKENCWQFCAQVSPRRSCPLSLPRNEYPQGGRFKVSCLSGLILWLLCFTQGYLGWWDGVCVCEAVITTELIE